MTDERHPIGSSFEGLFEEEMTLEAVDEAAVKEVIAWQMAEATRSRGLSKSAVAAARDAGRTRVNRLLDPQTTGGALHILSRAAAVPGERIKVELVDAEDDRYEGSQAG